MYNNKLGREFSMQLGVQKYTLNSLFSTHKTKIPKLTQIYNVLNNTNLQDFFNDYIFSDINDNM